MLQQAGGRIGRLNLTGSCSSRVLPRMLISITNIDPDLGPRYGYVYIDREIGNSARNSSCHPL